MRLTPQNGIGVMGLGKMGAGIIRHLDELDYRVVGYDPDEQSRQKLDLDNGATVSSVSAFADKLEQPRIIWMMVPHGVVDSALDDLINVLTAGDVVIDAGNSHFRKTQERNECLGDEGIHFIDAGVSGGPSGARAGAAIMVGGEDEVVSELSDLFTDLTVEDGFQHMGPTSAGHFTKMVHNGIEYGILQSIAEGFELLQHGPQEIDLQKAAQAYGNGSVIQSELIHLLQDALAEFGEVFDGVSSQVAAGGTGDWTLETAQAEDTTHDAIEAAVQFRHESDERNAYAGKVIMALRNKFGGHDPNPDND